MRPIYLNFLLVLLLVMVGCSPVSMLAKSTGVDPSLSWDAVTTDCMGSPITGVQYNVYAVSGPGPVPTAPTPDESPCGVLQLASGTPLNATPISSGTSFQAVVANGVWTFAVEAIDSSGGRSELSNNVIKAVRGRPGKPTNLTITLNQDGTLTIEEL